MAESHHDKVAVISGAARGIGQAFAQRLAHDGAHIVIADVLPATDTAKFVQEAGRHVLASNCDVSSESSVNALAAEVTARFEAGVALGFHGHRYEQTTLKSHTARRAQLLDSLEQARAAARLEQTRLTGVPIVRLL